jgi:hypothetical protein
LSFKQIFSYSLPRSIIPMCATFMGKLLVIYLSIWTDILLFFNSIDWWYWFAWYPWSIGFGLIHIYFFQLNKFSFICELDLWCRFTCYLWNVERCLCMHLNRYSFIYDEVARYLFIHFNRRYLFIHFNRRYLFIHFNRYFFIYDFGRLNLYLRVILHLELMNQSSMKTNVELESIIDEDECWIGINHRWRRMLNWNQSSMKTNVELLIINWTWICDFNTRI